MSALQSGFLKRAWLCWKMLPLPWRKRFFVGQDLRGNTYWTFRDQRADPSTALAQSATALRWRRIVQYPSSAHHSEVQVPPQWHQWLRHQRESAPTLEEQEYEAARQGRIKILAAEADARWEAKASLVDMPAGSRGARRIGGGAGETGERNTTQPGPALDTGRADTLEAKRAADEGVRRDAEPAPKAKHDPWAKAAARGPGETWQPEAWSPSGAKRR